MKSGNFFLPVAALFSFLLIGCNRDKTVQPQQKSIVEAVYASGYLVPERQYKVYALADGYITNVLKDAGDTVKRGEGILQIQSDVVSARYAASNSALELAQLNAGENSPVLSEQRSRLRSAQLKYSNDSLNFSRIKNMFEAGAVPQSQFDQAKLSFEVAAADVKSVTESYRKLREQLSVELKNAQSTVAGSAYDMNNYLVKSMMDGIVYDVTKRAGEAVRKNDLIAIVGDGDKKILELTIDQQDVGRVKRGQEVIVKMDVTGGTVYKATVTKVYPNMNQNDQSFRVDAEFVQPYELPFANTSVEANIVINQKDNALVIPKEALLPGNEVQIKSLKGDRRKVKIGIENLEFVEVLEGVTAKDELVIPAPKK